MKELEAELSSIPGYKKPENVKKEKGSLKSRTDPECGYIHQARKKGLGYLTEMTVDTSYGIITGVDCYPANQRESDIILEHLKGQPCKVSAKYSCGFPDPQILPIIVVDRYLDYFTTIMEDRLWQVLSMNAARAA